MHLKPKIRAIKCLQYYQNLTELPKFTNLHPKGTGFIEFYKIAPLWFQGCYFHGFIRFCSSWTYFKALILDFKIMLTTFKFDRIVKNLRLQYQNSVGTAYILSFWMISFNRIDPISWVEILKGRHTWGDVQHPRRPRVGVVHIFVENRKAIRMNMPEELSRYGRFEPRNPRKLAIISLEDQKGYSLEARGMPNDQNSC